MATSQQSAPAQTGNGSSEAEAKRLAQRQRAQRDREMQALRLQRENILSQRTSNPARRAALESALTHIEAQIAALG